ncbi:endonuclease/exonuclease/phosphatase family protein [Rhodococcus sp. G-MC3]|uniref:endonuclease/exonuclease/phosphatase family protein n=1 Tax=Rhodococcus sp. G-MC3 TaxID=3046209 RepID=UPI0024B97D80|nr:endonuclease/exonuclease/phosphatase family protein [Rhodococcus sp. G-MC3]MDJ0391835.1 endonuclease/exonuclease/phosphatase family protein [Rhodococcus sp. G-MC3]
MPDTPDRPTHRWRTAAGILAFLCFAASALGMFAYFSHTQNQYVVALASFAPILLTSSLVGAVAAALGRRWILLAASVTAAAVGVALFGPLYVSDTRAESSTATSTAESSPRTLRVMQSNLMLGLADPNEVVRLADANAVDVLTVQELTHDAERALDASGIAQLLPYHFTEPTVGGGGGAGIYSRFPLSAEQQLPEFVLSNLVVDLDVGARDPVRLYTVHPVPPYPTPATLWASEMELLRHDLSRSSETANVVVSGDFNSTRSHSRFRDILSDGFVDAADTSGSGLLATYPTDKPYPAVVGIDHVLTRGATATALRRVTIPGSDHHGLIADLELKS